MEFPQKNSGLECLAYHDGAFLSLLFEDIKNYKETGVRGYLIYIDKNDKMQLVYQKKIDDIGLTPALSDKWAFINLGERDGAGYKLAYAKVEEWKWQTLGNGIANARDMECYCDWHPELSPFDDYTPNTQHRKKQDFQKKDVRIKTIVRSD